MHLLRFTQFLFIGLTTCLFVLCAYLLHGVLIAVVLMGSVVFILIRFKVTLRVLHDIILGILFLTLLVVFLLTGLAFSVLILVHELLVFLNHSLQVLKNHLSCKEATYQGLHFDD